MQFCSIERGLEFHFIALTVFFWGNLDTHTMLMGLLHTSQAITLHFFAPSFLLCIFSAATHNSRKANVNRPTFSRWLTILYTHTTIFPCVPYLFFLQHRIYSRPGQIFFGKTPQTPRWSLGRILPGDQFSTNSDVVWPPIGSFKVGHF